jgi:hypothetical protein
VHIDSCIKYFKISLGIPSTEHLAIVSDNSLLNSLSLRNDLTFSKGIFSSPEG